MKMKKTYILLIIFTLHALPHIKAGTGTLPSMEAFAKRLLDEREKRDPIMHLHTLLEALIVDPSRKEDTESAASDTKIQDLITRILALQKELLNKKQERVYVIKINKLLRALPSPTPLTFHSIEGVDKGLESLLKKLKKIEGETAEDKAIKAKLDAVVGEVHALWKDRASKVKFQEKMVFYGKQAVPVLSTAMTLYAL